MHKTIEYTCKVTKGRRTYTKTYYIPVPKPEWLPGKVVLERLKMMLQDGDVQEEVKKEWLSLLTLTFDLEPNTALDGFTYTIDWIPTRSGPARPQASVFVETNNGHYASEGSAYGIGIDNLSVCMAKVLGDKFTKVGAVFFKWLCDVDYTGQSYGAFYSANLTGDKNDVYFPVFRFAGEGLESLEHMLKQTRGIARVFSMNSPRFSGSCYSNHLKLADLRYEQLS